MEHGHQLSQNAGDAGHGLVPQFRRQRNMDILLQSTSPSLHCTLKGCDIERP